MLEEEYRDPARTEPLELWQWSRGVEYQNSSTADRRPMFKAGCISILSPTTTTTTKTVRWPKYITFVAFFLHKIAVLVALVKLIRPSRNVLCKV